MLVTTSNVQELDFSKGNGLIPAIIQDAISGQVLMLGYMNQTSILKTIDSQKVTFFSRSRKELWTKGDTSGNYLLLVSIWHDCDKDALLVKVSPNGPACHLGTVSCFNEEKEQHTFLNHLETVIQDRYENPREKSYTAKLFKKGLDKIAQKVGEEAVELVIEAKNDDKDRFLNEAADLTFHLLVLLIQKKYSLNDVINILEQRHK